ncbi:BMA-CEC-1, isoform a [Dirofilaria immitis]|nr:BMA-CEC-1, isoform a [Dirofilaria immitis]
MGKPFPPPNPYKSYYITKQFNSAQLNTIRLDSIHLNEPQQANQLTGQINPLKHWWYLINIRHHTPQLKNWRQHNTWEPSSNILNENLFTESGFSIPNGFKGGTRKGSRRSNRGRKRKIKEISDSDDSDGDNQSYEDEGASESHSEGSEVSLRSSIRSRPETPVSLTKEPLTENSKPSKMPRKRGPKNNQEFIIVLQNVTSETKLNLRNNDEIRKNDSALSESEIFKVIKDDESGSFEEKNAKREAEMKLKRPEVFEGRSGSVQVISNGQEQIINRLAFVIEGTSGLSQSSEQLQLHDYGDNDESRIRIIADQLKNETKIWTDINNTRYESFQYNGSHTITEVTVNQHTVPIIELLIGLKRNLLFGAAKQLQGIQPLMLYRWIEVIIWIRLLKRLLRSTAEQRNSNKSQPFTMSTTHDLQRLAYVCITTKQEVLPDVMMCILQPQLQR